MILAKWGGSLLTDKGARGPPRYRAATARRLAREWAEGLALAHDRGVLVHGAGSFGHPYAVRHGVGRRPLRDPERAAVVARLHALVGDLQSRVVATLQAEGRPAVPVPAALVARADGARLRLDAEPFARLLRLGLQPVTGGDVVLDRRLGARILGGDELLHHLARPLGARRVVVATDVDGVVLGGRLTLLLPPRAAAAACRRVAQGRDATGGMRGKLEWAARLQAGGVEVVIVNGAVPGRFRDAVAGRRSPGTRLPPAIGI